jgi:hypothetical protein
MHGSTTVGGIVVVVVDAGVQSSRDDTGVPSGQNVAGGPVVVVVGATVVVVGVAVVVVGATVVVVGGGVTVVVIARRVGRTEFAAKSPVATDQCCTHTRPPGVVKPGHDPDALALSAPSARSVVHGPPGTSGVPPHDPSTGRHTSCG